MTYITIINFPEFDTLQIFFNYFKRLSWMKIYTLLTCFNFFVWNKIGNIQINHLNRFF